jgi:uncharacterized protein (TIGR04255 family)
MLHTRANVIGATMAKQRHLQNAPITEALIDIHVSPRDGLTFAELRDVIGAAEFGYYVKGPISQGTFAVIVAPDGQPPLTTGESAQVGMRIHSSDEKYVAQSRLTGFTLSRLPPYETWTDLIEEAKRLWAIYVTRLAPKRVIRVATRYINNLRLPLETGTSYQTYLHKLVDVPEEAPQVVEAFFQRFQLVDAATSAHVNLTLALDGMSADGLAPVILDVDAFAVTDLHPTDLEMWRILERLRELKNRSFFGTITEQAAELYE